MTVYLDSADLDDLHAAAKLGFVRGVTTNPTLLRRVTSDPLKHLTEILAATEFPAIFYQPTGAYGDLLEEALTARAQDPERITLKIIATPAGASLADALIRHGARVALTAAQTPTAMIVAESLGCTGVIPYVDRASRDPRTGSELVRALAEVRKGDTAICAASVKHAGQFARAYADGADAVTAPLDVLAQVLNHPAGLEAEAAFTAEYASPDPLPLPEKGA